MIFGLYTAFVTGFSGSYINLLLHDFIIERKELHEQGTGESL